MTRSAMRSQGGYSLLQMAMALVVVGVLMAPLIQAYTLYKRHQMEATTYRNVQAAVDAVQQYRELNGFYPCPAPLTAARGTAAYGNATDCNADATYTALTAGQCASGICVQESVRADLGAVGDPQRRVLVGAVPFRLLQMDEKTTVDGYRDRLVYVVTQSLTQRTAFNDNNGGISVVDENGNSVARQDSAPDGSVHFMIISPGATRDGAYTSQGTLVTPCPAAVGDQMDAINCTDGFEDGASDRVNAVYRAAMTNTQPGATYYDDVVSYFTKITDPVWKRTDDERENITDLSPDNIGVGTADPQTELHISSSLTTPALRAYGTNGSDGKILVDEICDEKNPGSCFEPSLIAGEDHRMSCIDEPEDKYVLGIKNNEVICGKLTIKCPDHLPVLNGINPDKTPICSAVPNQSCGDTRVSVCDTNDVTLRQSDAVAFGTGRTSDGTYKPNSWSTYSLGSCRRVQYRCSNGSWIRTSNSGSCTNNRTGGTWWQNVACPAGYERASRWVKYENRECSGTRAIEDPGCGDCDTDRPEWNSNIACSSVNGAWTGTIFRKYKIRLRNGVCETYQTYYNDDDCRCADSSASDGDTRWVKIQDCPGHFVPPTIDGVQRTGVMRKQRFSTSRTSCGWRDTAEVRGCECDGLPRTEERNPTCNLGCQDVGDRELWEMDVDASCNVIRSTERKTRDGTCVDKVFTWRRDSFIQMITEDPPSSALFENSRCACAEKGDERVCYPDARDRHKNKCKCQ